MDLEELENERKSLQRAVSDSRMIADALVKQDKENKRLWIAFAAVLVSLLISVSCNVKQTMDIAEQARLTAEFMANAQEMMDEAMWKALNAAGEITVTTTEQSVDGGNATINNVDGDQFNDSAQKVGGY